MRSTTVSSWMLVLCLLGIGVVQSFVVLPRASSSATTTPMSAATTSTTTEEARSLLKKSLLESLGQQLSADHVLCCPVSLQPLSCVTRFAGPFGQLRSMQASGGYSYTVNDCYANLIASSDEEQVSMNNLALRQDLFRSPFVSFLYERGWRNQFKLSGFPGVDQEFEEIMAFFEPIIEKQGPTTVVDLSCGSGLMTRRLVRSNKFNRVIAADYSESMLRETQLRFKREKIPVPELIRADAARLPFQTESVDAIHAGAALHCWPSLEESLREVNRVLKPGGRFFASTFEVNDRLRGNTFRFFHLDELKKLLIASGFPADQVDVRRVGTACLIAKAIK